MKLFWILTVAGTLSQSGSEGPLQTEVQTLPAPPADNGYNFAVGREIAISDEWVAIADDTAGAENSGEVYLYRQTPSGWTHTQTLAGQKQSAFGSSVALDRGTLVIGSFTWKSFLGRVDTFVLQEGRWVLQQEILPEGLSADEGPRFGQALALSGDVLVIGARGVDHPVQHAGEIRVYERSEGVWTLMQRFRQPPSDEVLAHDMLGLGSSLAVSEDTIVAGVPYGMHGAVRLYERGATGWEHTVILDNPSVPALPGDNFGLSVDIDGDTLVAGRPCHTAPSPRLGRAFVYERDEGGAWQLSGQLRASDGQGDADGGDKFGWSVAVSGGRVAVGAPGAWTQGSDTGTVYSFQRHAGMWPVTEDRRLVASDSSITGEFLGVSVDLHGPFIAAGASGALEEGYPEGKGYFFTAELGIPRCTPMESAGTLRITGSAAVEDEHLILTLAHAPPDALGLLLASRTAGTTPFSPGPLCMGGSVTPLGLLTVGLGGAALRELDFGAPAFAGHLVPGSTWHFQVAHEAAPGSRQLELLTNAVSLTLQ